MLTQFRAWRLWAASAAQGKAYLPGAWRDTRFVWGPPELRDEAMNRP